MFVPARNIPAKSFTLVELLIVIIIIGILAVISVQQYQKLIEKSYSAEACTYLKKIREAAEVSFMTDKEVVNCNAGTDDCETAKWKILGMDDNPNNAPNGKWRYDLWVGGDPIRTEFLPAGVPGGNHVLYFHTSYQYITAIRKDGPYKYKEIRIYPDRHIEEAMPDPSEYTDAF